MTQSTNKDRMIVRQYRRLIDAFRGHSRAEDVVLALVEILGLRIRSADSLAERPHWQELVSSISNQERLSVASSIFEGTGWRTDNLEKVFSGDANEHQFTDAIKLAEQLCRELPDVELAWELVELLNESARYEPASIPRELACLISDVLGIQLDDHVLCAGASLIGLNLELSRLVSRLTWESFRPDYIAEIVLRIADAEVDTRVAPTTGFESIDFSADRYSKAVVHTPWGMRASQEAKQRWEYLPLQIRPTSVESLYIQYALKLVRDSVVAVVAPGFLFKTAGTDRDLKRYLVDKGYVRAVIRLPNKLFRATSVAPNLLVLDKDKHHEQVVFVDASGERFFEGASRSLSVLKAKKDIVSLIKDCSEGDVCRVVETQELAANDYNLDVSRYVLLPEERGLQAFFRNKEVVELQHLVTIVRAQATKAVEDGVEVSEVNPSNIELTGFLGRSGKETKVDEYVLHRIDKQRLRSGDVVLAAKGSIGRVAIVPEDAPRNLIAGQSFVILRLKPNSPITDPVVLYSYLASSLVQTLIKSKAAGATVQMIKMQDISSLPVVVPSAQEQSAIIQNHEEIKRLYREIETIQENIADLKEKFWTA